MRDPATLRTKVVARDDVALIVDTVGLDALMDEMIERLTEAIVSFDETRTVVRTRDGFHYHEPNVGLVEWMPVLQTGEAATVKMVGYHPHNPEMHQLPTILSTISVYETATGHLSGLADGTFLTALRTGAASAVASRVLARPSSNVVGLVGCGAQSITQLHALLRLFPIEQVLIADSKQANIDSFNGRTAEFMPDGVVIKPVPLETIMENADIVCTSTSVEIDEGPLFDDLPTKPWLHINAVGSDFPGKVELPASLLRRALVCPDVREQAVKEGECQLLAAEEIGPSLAHVVAHPGAYESWQEDLTVFDSTGWALGDQVAMKLLLHYADALDVGTEVALEDIGDDPLDPYRLGRDVPGTTTTAPIASEQA